MTDPVVLCGLLGDDPPTATLHYGVDVREGLRRLPDASVHMVATSPPYWSLRDYSTSPSVWGGEVDCPHQWDKDNCTLCKAWQGQLGLEPTPELYVEHIVQVFREVRRVLRSDGVVWLNLGDTYAGYWGENYAHLPFGEDRTPDSSTMPNKPSLDFEHSSVKPKDLVGIPWRVALALQQDGWWLRSDVIWAKPNCMPESVTDRPTKSHEYVFLLTPGTRYFYDQDAIREPHAQDSLSRLGRGRSTDHKWVEGPGDQTLNSDAGLEKSCHPKGRNKRSVWVLPPKSYKGAHFATWPPELVEPMILAGSSRQGCCSSCGAPRLPDGGQPSCSCAGTRTLRCTVLDPFSGSATTGMVALAWGRNYIGIDLNPEYLDLARQRLGYATSAAPAAEAEISALFEQD